MRVQHRVREREGGRKRKREGEEGRRGGMVTERPRKKGKRYFNCTPSKSRPHEPILLLSVFNSVQF